MKKLSMILAICVLTSCSMHNTQHVIPLSLITLVYDITDSLGCIPEPDPILSLYDFKNNIDQSAGYRLVLISDKKLNPVEEIHIEDGVKSEKENTNEEVDFRVQLVNSFYDAFRKSISNFHKEYEHGGRLQHSECFATISSELRLLSESPAFQKVLIVYSDLQENTNVFSCYRKDDQQLLQSNPGKVAMLLNEHCPLLENLKDITVYFVYKPYSRVQDIQFDEMVGIYTQLLLARGARVIVQATNKYYGP